MLIPKHIFIRHMQAIYLERDRYALSYTVEYICHCLREYVPFNGLIDTEELDLDSHVLNLIMSLLSDEERFEVSLVN